MDKMMPYYEDKENGIEIYNGDCLEVMKTIQFNLTSISLLAIIFENGGYYGKR